MSGRDGKFVTGRQIRDRLFKEALHNVSIRIEESDTSDAIRLFGRGELQLAILLEQMRREGFEVCVSKPEVKFREDSLFNLKVPMGLPGVNTDIFVPKYTWKDKEKYDQKAKELAEMFKNNFKQYSNYKGIDYTEFGPK